MPEGAGAAVTDPSMGPKAKNGSAPSVAGDARGVFRRVAVRFVLGDARRERVLRKVDFVLRLGGPDASMGRSGSVAVG